MLNYEEETSIGKLLYNKADIIITIHNPKHLKLNTMLNVKQIRLRPNQILVNEMPIVIPESEGGVLIPDEIREQRKKSKLVRFGTIVHTGEIEENILNSSCLKGKQQDQLVGTIIMYTVHDIDVLLDTAIEEAPIPVIIDIAFIRAEIEETPLVLDSEDK